MQTASYRAKKNIGRTNLYIVVSLLVVTIVALVVVRYTVNRQVVVDFPHPEASDAATVHSTQWHVDPVSGYRFLPRDAWYYASLQGIPVSAGTLQETWVRNGGVGYRYYLPRDPWYNVVVLESENWVSIREPREQYELGVTSAKVTGNRISVREPWNQYEEDMENR